MLSNELITSFVVRFILRQAPEAGGTSPLWRGVIRHVQSGQEAHFHRLDEVLAFMARFLPAEDSSDQGTGPSEDSKTEAP